MFNRNRLPLILALGVGLVIGLGVGYFSFRNHASSNPVVAEIQGQKLTEDELRKQVAADLIPISSEEYLALHRGAEDWIRESLLEKDSQDRGIPVEKIYQELWTRVQVTPNQASDFYNQNKELFNQPYDKVSSQIFQELRRKEYANVKQVYLDELSKKYKAVVHLKKPEFFVEGMPLPQPSAFPTLAQPAVPSPAPTIITFDDLKGRPSKGPENATITMVEFSDFECSFCKQVVPTLDQLMTKYQGKIRRVWRHYPLPKHQSAERAHEASECAAEQGKFWEYHDKLFETQGAPRDDKTLTELAKQTGLNTQQFESCLSSNKYKEQVRKDFEKGNAVGVTGTPAVFINGQMVSGAQPYANFERVVEGILNPGKVIPLPPPPAPVVVQFDDLKGKPALGPEKAKVTLVEFSDFHCQFCKRVSPTLDELMKNYDGKIRRVWRHYPLPMHPTAPRTHEASECAAEQGKFWEFHNEVFKQDAPPQDDVQHIQLAKNIGLNEKKFQTCLTSGKYKEKVQKDVQKGQQSGVRGTPAVFVNGKLVSGAQPYAAFDQAIQKELSQS